MRSDVFDESNLYDLVDWTTNVESLPAEIDAEPTCSAWG